MEELPQDLGLALEDPSLKHDSDEQGYISGSDMKIDFCRRRKMRKRRTTDILFQNGQCNPSGQLNNSPKSSSSVDESTRNSRYVESYTANCSEETDERPRHGPRHRSEAMRTVDRSHHKRVFKQAKPCYCESDSHNENAPIFPRKQRKKKFRKIVIDSNDAILVPENEMKFRSQYRWKTRQNQQSPAKSSMDDVGGDGDDEMTDFYAESDGGSVVGVPHQSCNHWIIRNGSSFKDEKVWLYGIRKIKSRENLCSGGMIDARTETSRTVEKQNKYSKNSVRYGQRHKRRMKIKKTKVKNLREQDVSQMNKLSLGNRSKRMRLEGTKISNITHGRGVSATISFKEDMEMPSADGNRKW